MRVSKERRFLHYVHKQDRHILYSGYFGVIFVFCFIIYIYIHMQLLQKVKLSVYDIYRVCCNCVSPA